MARGVKCLPQPAEPCPRGRALGRGRIFVVRGSGLKQVRRVIFEGRRGAGDDVTARVRRPRATRLVARVPRLARSGRVVLVDRYGGRSRMPRKLRVARAPKAPSVDIAPASRFFYGGRRRPSVTLTAAQSGTARVELLSEETGAVVRTWSVQSRLGQTSTISWDGAGPDGIQRLGAYRFRVAPGSSSARVSASSSGQSFLFADHLFPIRGRHNLGYSQTNNFGGARKHKGQDMFARCGTRLAAARGGRVQYAGYHRYAGYYAVIDGAETGVDYVYMHMRRPASVETGDRVFTGQKLGEVGETGRATGCHLHFEMWSAPGWYQGGSAFDPLPDLRRWDSYS